jgi:hypothetical protein
MGSLTGASTALFNSEIINLHFLAYDGSVCHKYYKRICHILVPVIIMDIFFIDRPKQTFMIYIPSCPSFF